MEEYARSSVASPNTPGGVSIYSRGSYHFLRTANTNGNDSLMLKKRNKNSISLPVLLGKKPRKFKLNPQYYELKPLLMMNKRLPDKKVNVPVIVNKNDDWRTDDIHMNMLHLKLQKRRRDKLDEMTIIMNNLQKQLDAEASVSSSSRSESRRRSNSVNNSNRSRSNTAGFSINNYTPGSTHVHTPMSDLQPQYDGDQFAPSLDFSIPSGLQPKYHISSPKFVGIHPWSRTTNAAFLPEHINKRNQNNFSQQKPPFTAGFVNNSNNRMGAFYTRRGQRNIPGSSRGKLRPVITPIKSAKGTTRTQISEDINNNMDDGAFLQNTFVTSANTNIENMEMKAIELRPLKSGKTGLFSGDDQILPVDDSRTIDSWKWGLQ